MEDWKQEIQMDLKKIVASEPLQKGGLRIEKDEHKAIGKLSQHNFTQRDKEQH